MYFTIMIYITIYTFHVVWFVTVVKVNTVRSYILLFLTVRELTDSDSFQKTEPSLPLHCTAKITWHRLQAWVHFSIIPLCNLNSKLYLQQLLGLDPNFQDFKGKYPLILLGNIIFCQGVNSIEFWLSGWSSAQPLAVAE